jgi:hypothetical protein
MGVMAFRTLSAAFAFHRRPNLKLGRTISITASLITAPLSESFVRAPIISLTSVSFLAAALIWFQIPDTVDRKIDV